MDDSGTQDSPYRDASFPFDPATGVRLLGEIQAEGLRAAGALVDRLVHLVDGPRAPEAGTDAVEDDQAPPPPGPAGVDLGAVLPWFDLWRDLVERTSDTVQRFRAAQDGTAGGEVRLDVNGGLAPTHPLRIELGSDGAGAAEMWLHNGTSAAHGSLVPTCGPLTGVEATVLPAAWTFDPPQVDGLPPRSSRGVMVSVAVGTETAPGTYRGIVQVRGAETVWMPVEVVVPEGAR
ncbi:MAG: hypothetical protein NTV23_15795 [Propionibacteriales bacterium]|nr:hypothetical protein [Propionibacteriales bacterium]